MNFPFGQCDFAPEEPSLDTIKKAAYFLKNSCIVGWYQGHGEIGPRALGNRSILMDPRIPNGKDIINKKVKHREWWRPFGASILEEYTGKYFTSGLSSPFMLYNYWFKDRTKFPAITHVDGSCRIQTVSKAHSIFYNLIDEFRKVSGVPILLNTSLNLSGKPIVAHPDEAIRILESTEMDYLIIGDKIYSH